MSALLLLGSLNSQYMYIYMYTYTSGRKERGRFELRQSSAKLGSDATSLHKNLVIVQEHDSLKLLDS